MVTRNPDDQSPSPRETSESEEQELAERLAAERGERARRDQDDPREEEGWTQPESSAQKGAVRDEEEG